MWWHKVQLHKERLLSKNTRANSRIIWRYGVSALIGVYLVFSPLILGTSQRPESTLNAIAVGIGLLVVVVSALIIGGSRTAEMIRLALGGWLLLAPFVLSFADSAASRNAWIAGILLVGSTDTTKLTSAMDRMLRSRSRVYRGFRLSPERIIDCQKSVQTGTPETLSKQIVERSEQIHKTLLNTDLQIEAEMCVLGYKSCVADMLLLVGRIEEELPEAGYIRRHWLKAARREAEDSLSKTREVLPPSTVRVLHP